MAILHTVSADTDLPGPAAVTTVGVMTLVARSVVVSSVVSE
jgi:hypothetical protein